MNEDEVKRIEDGLRRIAPAPLPSRLMGQLRAATTVARPLNQVAPRRVSRWGYWLASWRALAVATPAATVLVIWLMTRQTSGAKPESTGLEASAVVVGHSLVASFDTVARLPGGEPVRFRCREWQDNVVIHDDEHGVVISQSTPRVEVIPMRFETY